jgi:hypothetical protein
LCYNWGCIRRNNPGTTAEPLQKARSPFPASLTMSQAASPIPLVFNSFQTLFALAYRATFIFS